MNTTRREYKLGPVAMAFLNDRESDVIGLIGPYGSGKSTLIPLRALRDVASTVPDSDGVRRYRALILRGTFSMIESALLPVMVQHLPPGTVFTKGSPITAKYKGGGVEIHCDFIALDRDEDVRRIQGGSYDGIFADEARDTQWPIVQTAMSRARAVTDQGKAKPLTIALVSNPMSEDHWFFKSFVGSPLKGWRLYKQPSGLSDAREGPYDRGYYQRMVDANADNPAWIDLHVHGNFGVYVIAGDRAVPAFNASRHLAELVVSPVVPLIVGIDVGVSWNALVFMQRIQDQLRVVGELAIENMPAVMAAPKALAYVRDYLQDAPVGACTVDPSAEQRSAVSGELVLDIWRSLTRWSIMPAPSPRVSERINAMNAVFQSSNSEGKPSIVIDPRACPILVRGLAGEYRWKMRKTALGVVSEDGELDKTIRPAADIADAAGYGIMGSGVHSNLVDMARAPRQWTSENVGGFADALDGARYESWVK